MLKETCAFLLALCLLLTVCGCDGGAGTESSPSPSPSRSAVPEASPAPEESTEVQLSQRAENWAADISYLKRNYKMYHPDPFYLCSEEEFNWKLDQLVAKVDDLSDNDIYFELAAIIAGMGDIHTAVEVPDSLFDREFPVLVRCFGDKPYLYGYLEGYGQFSPYLLREIVAVNGVDITYLREKAASFSDPFNSWRCKAYFSSSGFFIPAFFDWAGCDCKEGYTLQVLNENQEVESIELPVISSQEYMGADVVWPETWHEPFTFLSQESDRADYLPGENGGCVYLYIGRMDVLHGKQFYQDLFGKTTELVKSHPDCVKLVIDLRFNPGGAVVIADYIHEDLQLLKELSIQQVFVITSGYTTSGGILCLSMFKEELGALHIGEPTGQFTSFFCHVTTPMILHLPQSQLAVCVATDWWDGSAAAEEQYDENGRLYPWEYTVLPDVYIEQDIEDTRQGKDSVIEWVLAQ